MVDGETRIALLMLACREWGIQVPIPHFHLVFFIFSTPSLLLVFFELAVIFFPSSFLLHALFRIPKEKKRWSFVSLIQDGECCCPAFLARRCQRQSRWVGLFADDRHLSK